MVIRQFDAFFHHVQADRADDIVLDDERQDEDRLYAALAQHFVGRGGQGVLRGLGHDDRPPLGNRHLAGRVVLQRNDKADRAVRVQAAGAVGDDG